MQLLLVTVALVVILAFFSVAASGFAKPTIYLDIVLQSAYTGVMALGATFVIATSGIDLSVVAIANVTGICAALTLRATLTGPATASSMSLAVLIALGVAW